MSVTLFVLSVACGGEAPSDPLPEPAESSGAEAEASPGATPEAPAETTDAATGEEPAPAEPAAEPAAPPGEPPRYAALITSVKGDYDAWKEAFDAQLQKRKDAFIVRHTVLLNPKRPAKVTVLLFARHQDPLQAFLDDEGRKEAMKDAGVKGKPKIEVLSLLEERTNRDLSGMFIAVLKLAVPDVDDWKAAFDADAEAREEAELFGHVIATAVKDDDSVYLYLQAREEEALDAYLKGKALKAFLKKSGVKDDPEIRRFVEEDDASYE